MGLRKIKLTVHYDGSGYHGWQEQPGYKTVQGEIDNALSRLFDRKTHITGSSRTDAGVSALGQVGVIKIDSPIPVENIAGAITDRLPEDIVVTSAEQVGKGFDVIRDARRKLYRYTIYNGKIRPVLHIRHCWHYPYRLDVKAMEKAANYIVGTNDFKSFASAADKRKNSVRTVFRCGVTQNGNWIYIEIEGDGFLYNMVRNIAGTLAEIGRGQRHPDDIPEILRAKDRKEAGMLAPASGLCLCWIKY